MKLIKAILLSLLTVTIIITGLFVLTIVPAWLSIMVSIMALVTIFTAFWYKASYGEPAITPQILEKNGFVKVEENEYSCSYQLLIPTGYEKNSYTIKFTFFNEPITGVDTILNCWGWIPPENSGLNDIHLCNIESVHELQHALRLCGIEKNIEL